MSFTLNSSAQVDPQRVYELARFHLSGFFYWLTYQHERSVGWFWPGGFFPLNLASRRDWGNPLQRGFMSLVITWPLRLFAVTAEKFFKVAIRRSPNVVCWSWALEWNESLRVIGLFGDEGAARDIVQGLPHLQMSPFFKQPDGSVIRYRAEVPLATEDDVLFNK